MINPSRFFNASSRLSRPSKSRTSLLRQKRDLSSNMMLHQNSKNNFSSSVAQELISKKKPSFLRWFTDPLAGFRYKKAMESVDDATRTERLQALKHKAEENAKQFKEYNYKPSNRVQVIDSDHLTLAQQKHMNGSDVPVVSFNASPDWFGGAFFDAKGDAAEESLFYRSTAPSLVQPFLDKGFICVDEETGVYRYTLKGRRYLTGAMPMDEQQRAILRQINPDLDTNPQQVLLTKSPLVYTRSPLHQFEVENLHEYPEAFRTGLATDTGLSYNLLKPHKMTLFRPLFMASSDLSAGYMFDDLKETTSDQQTCVKVDWEDPNFLKTWASDCRRRIAAELDTYLIDQHGKPKQAPLILCASGIGCYQNSPHRVAKIYREELEKRSEFLDDVSFSIYTGSGFGKHGFRVFHQHLDGLKLGKNHNNELAQEARPSPSP